MSTPCKTTEAAEYQVQNPQASLIETAAACGCSRSTALRARKRMSGHTGSTPQNNVYVNRRRQVRDARRARLKQFILDHADLSYNQTKAAMKAAGDPVTHRDISAVRKEICQDGQIPQVQPPAAPSGFSDRARHLTQKWI